jgi:hypothetical protein
LINQASLAYRPARFLLCFGSLLASLRGIQCSQVRCPVDSYRCMRSLIEHLPEGIAYKAACTLRLDSEKTSPAHLECASESSGPSSLVDEIRRRLFWATWITNCINSDHYLIGTSVNNRIVNLPLPMDDLTFRRSGIQTPLSPIRGPPKASEPPSNDASRSPPSIMAEIVKLMMLW